MLNYENTLAFAKDIARETGSLIVKRQEEAILKGMKTLNIRTKSSPRDFVTSVDGEAQRLIIERIQKRHPDHRFLAEEEGAQSLGDARSPYQWIIDPIDGTTNFIHGKPNFGCIIALREAGKTVLGVIARPHFQELFSAIRGGGAFLNDVPMHLRETPSFEEAVVCSNLMHRAERGEDGTLSITTPPCGSIENYGNAAQEITEVVRGWNDGAFFVDGAHLWDTEAGCLMVEEAGGKSRTELNDPSDERGCVSCVASTEAIFEDLCSFVFKGL